MLEDGEGEPEDLKEAAYWFNRAADHGSADAVYNCARMYDDRCKILGQDDAQQTALKLYKKAASMGVVEASLKVKKIKTMQRLRYAV